MIQEIKIQNFLSFRDETTFSFEATKDTFAEEYQVVEVAKGVRLLRFAMVYGANASGKSNLLKAFDFLRHFWHNAPQLENEPTGCIPFKLDTHKQPSRFELVFYIENTKYNYALVLDDQQVYREKLSVYRSVQPTMIFLRELKNGVSVIEFNATAVKVTKIEKEKLKVECLKNMSLFVAKAKVNVNIPEIETVMNWIATYFSMPTINAQTNMFNYAERKISEDNALKMHVIDFLHQADFNITNISTETKSVPLSKNLINVLMNDDDIPSEMKERIKKSNTLPRRNTLFEHSVTNNEGKESYLFEKEDESQGTLRTLGIETAIFNALQKKSFLAIDEIETSLHPQLLKFILLNFLLQGTPTQLLITTHYDPLLSEISTKNNSNLFRTDSVWFTDKDPSGNSNVYSLVEFSGLSKLSSFTKSYNNNLFGAFPKIDM